MSKISGETFFRAGVGVHAENRGVLHNMAKLVTVLLITTAVGESMYILGLGTQNMIMIYMLAVLVVSVITPTYVYGVLAALMGTLAYDFQLTAPRLGFSFTIGLPVTLLIMLLVTIAVSTMTARIKERAQIAFDRELRAQQLYEINQKLLAARSLDAIAALTGEYMQSHLGRPAVLYTSDPPETAGWVGNAPMTGDDRVSLLYTAEQARKAHRMFKIGESEAERPFDDSGYDVYNVPIASKGKILGVLGVACGGIPMDQHELVVVKMLVGQVALALELQHMADSQAKITVDAEKEKIRSTLLRSISHDLRTPLTGILGASSAILEQKDLDDATRESLVGDIKLDAQWLIRMVENILLITRISGDAIQVKKKPEAAEEVVSEAVAIARKRFPGYTFHARIPETLLMVPMDSTLISQVMINLLENAVKNSPDGSLVLVDLRKKDDFAVFDVMDNGSGIPEDLLDNLFEVHVAAGSTDAQRGMGLGLSICKAIVHAHGGTIEGRNRDKQGARFSFSLPLCEADKTDE